MIRLQGHEKSSKQDLETVGRRKRVYLQYYNHHMSEYRDIALYVLFSLDLLLQKPTSFKATLKLSRKCNWTLFIRKPNSIACSEQI